MQVVQDLLIVVALIGACSLPLTAACSSRPTAPELTTTRPDVTFQIMACPPAYAAGYCLNNATCFTVQIQNQLLYNCECTSGFIGHRCEYKDLNRSYLPTRNRAMPEKASIVSGALLFMAMCCVVLGA